MGQGSARPSIPAHSTTRPKRIVMVVDNHVRGDSRVQKIAESVAASGHDVTLLGRSADLEDHVWQIGEAEVRLLPVPLTLLASQGDRAGWSLRWPIAYPNKRTDRQRDALLRSRRSAYSERAVTVKNDRLRGRGVFFGRAAVVLGRIELRIWAAWHRARHRQFRKAIFHRKHEPAALDRLRARWISVTGGPNAWRTLDPTLADFDLGFRRELQDLQPDLIHAHDFRMIGVAVRAAERLSASGTACRVVYDAHEYMPGVHARNLSWRLGNEMHEAAHIRRADAVVTVSEQLADLLVERHGLREVPTVILNAPKAVSARPARDVRDVCELANDVPLLVYTGSPAPQRGLMTIVEALPMLAGVHAALLLPTGSVQIAGLLSRAVELGVANRLHVLPYVAPDDVVGFIRSADIGVAPLHHQVNHEISIITKYFDYAHAGLPVVVSDVRTLADVTRKLGNGEVFTAEDTAGFASAVERVLADLDRYSGSYSSQLLAEWSWDAQAEALLAVYSRLLAVPGNDSGSSGR